MVLKPHSCQAEYVLIKHGDFVNLAHGQDRHRFTISQQLTGGAFIQQGNSVKHHCCDTDITAVYTAVVSQICKLEAVGKKA